MIKGILLRLDLVEKIAFLNQEKYQLSPRQMPNLVSVELFTLLLTRTFVKQQFNIYLSFVGKWILQELH